MIIIWKQRSLSFHITMFSFYLEQFAKLDRELKFSTSIVLIQVCGKNKKSVQVVEEARREILREVKQLFDKYYNRVPKISNRSFFDSQAANSNLSLNILKKCTKSVS